MSPAFRRAPHPVRPDVRRAPHPVRPGDVVRLRIASTWSGLRLPPHEEATVTLSREGEGDDDALRILIEAPFHGDPPPPEDGQPREARDGLWSFEVVELFLGSSSDALPGPAAPAPSGPRPYTELEFGPHGHALGLSFSHYRQRVALFPVEVVRCEVMRPVWPGGSLAGGARWTAEARVPLSRLPPLPWWANAFAMHGEPPGRVHAAAFPASAERVPDFHAPDTWRALPLTEHA
jgi:hypothetical protein